MSGLFTNPELVRHLRTELRPRRIAIVLGVSYVVIALMVLSFWQGNAQSKNLASDLFRPLYSTLISMQVGAFLLWSLYACGQRIASERQQRTFDFLRTTSLTAAELTFGMVFGLPAMAYVFLFATLPVVVLLGLLAGFSLLAIIASYAMLLIVGIVLCLFGLLVSMLQDKPQPLALLFLLWMLSWPAMALVSEPHPGSPFPALVSLAVVPALLPLYGIMPTGYNMAITTVPLFGFKVPALAVSVLLYASFAMWVVFAILRNLKKDLEDMRLLSRWHALAMTAYVNVLAFALLDIRGILAETSSPTKTAFGITTGFLFLNYALLYAVGLSMLSSSPRLRAWWRRSGNATDRYWTDDAPPLSWMAAAAVTAFVVFEIAVLSWSRSIPVSTWSIPILPIFVMLGHVAKDVMFLQWCSTTRMKKPIIKGAMFLGLYYIAVLVLVVSFSGDTTRQDAGLAFFTPFAAFVGEQRMASAYGAGLQIALALLLLRLTEQKLARPARIMPSGSAAAA